MTDITNDTDERAARLADLVENKTTTAPHPVVGKMADENGGDIRDDEALAAGLAAGDDIAKISQEAIALCVNEPPNDIGNAMRLLHHFGDDIRFVSNVGWFVWNGKRWQFDGTEKSGFPRLERMAQLVAGRITLEADAMSASPAEQRAINAGIEARGLLDAHLKEKPEADDGGAWETRRRELSALVAEGEGARRALQGRKIARRKYAISSGNSGKLVGMVKRAAPHRTIDPSALDADPHALNLENGTLHFVAVVEDDPDGTEATGYRKRIWKAVLREHDRRDLISKIAPVSYDPRARSPHFEASIEKFQPNEPTRAFLQRFHGYALTGLTGEQCLVFNFGDGANWKSTFNVIVAKVMGDYATTINFESLSGDGQRSGSQASPDIARLPGARLVQSSEPGRGVQFKESLIKSLTGGEPILTRHNFGDFFEFTPSFKMVLAGNHKPSIGGVDHGIWRRIRFVLWPTQIADHERRPMNDILAEIEPEFSGVLNWLVAGTLAYLGGGLRTPQEVVDSTAQYREEMDPVGCFVGDCVSIVPPPEGKPATAMVQARVMHDAFLSWCHENSVKPWGERTFASAMSQKGFTKVRKTSSRFYENVALHDVPERPRARQGGNEPPHPADAMDEAIPV